MTLAERRRIRIFLSSPEDVLGERRIAEAAIRRLSREFDHELEIETVSSQREQMPARAAELPAPSSADIAVVLMWSELGAALPRRKSLAGALSGRMGLSATEWEFEEGLAAKRAGRRPQLLHFRKTTPVLTEMADREAVLRQLRDREAVAAFFAQWRARRGEPGVTWTGFAEAAEFEALLVARLRPLLRAELSGEPMPAWEGEGPFRGLRAFGREHAPFFFGRTRARHALRELATARMEAGAGFVLVTGAAGSGKTSLVQAGLWADLETAGVLPGVTAVRVAPVLLESLQGSLPGALAAAIFAPEVLPRLRAEAAEDAEPVDDATQLTTLLAEPPKLLRAALRKALTAAAGRSARLFVLVDGLDRLFADDRIASADREAFAATLETLAGSGEALVVATLRADFLERLGDIPALARLCPVEAIYRLPAPDESELRDMIRGPAAVAGLRFEAKPEGGASLDDALATEAMRFDQGLPLLQFALEQLWQRRSAEGELRWEAFEALDGLSGAIAARAEQVQSALADPARVALPGLLRRLVSIGPEPQARVCALPLPLDGFPEESPEWPVIEAFSAPEVGLFIAERSTLRLAHEALLTQWPLVQEQIDRERAERLRARLPAIIPPAEVAMPTEPAIPMPAGVGLLRRRSRFALAGVVAGFIALLAGVWIYASSTRRELDQVREATLRERESNSLERAALAARNEAALAQRETELRRARENAAAERAGRSRDDEERRERTRTVANTLGEIARAARTAAVAEDETGTAIGVQAASALAGQGGDHGRIINPLLIDAAERLGIVTDPSLRRILSYRLMHQSPTSELLHDGQNSVIQIGSSGWVIPEAGEPARIENAFIRSYAFAPDRSSAILFTDDDRILIADRRGQLRHSFDTGRLSFSGEVIRAPSANARGMRPLREATVGFVAGAGGSYWIVAGAGEAATPYRVLTVIEPVTGANDTRAFADAWKLDGSCGEVILDGQRVGLGLARGRLPSRATGPQGEGPARRPAAGTDLLCPQIRQELRSPLSEITLITAARQAESEFWMPFQPDLLVPLPADDLPGEPFSPQDAEQLVPGGAAAMDEFTGGTSLAIGDSRYVFYPRRAGANSLGVCAIGGGRTRCLQSFCGENCPTDIDFGASLFAIIGASLDAQLAVVDLQEMRYLPGPSLPRDGVSIAFLPRSGDLVYGTANRQVWRFRPGAPPVRRQFYSDSALGRWEGASGARNSPFARIAALEEVVVPMADSLFFLDTVRRKTLRCARDPRSFEADRSYLRQELACVGADGRVLILSPERRYVRWISDPIEPLGFGPDAERDRIVQAVQMRFSGEPGETPNRPVDSVLLVMPDRLVVLDYASGFVLLSLAPGELPEAAAGEQFQAARIDEDGRIWLRTDRRELLRRAPLSRSEIADRVGALTSALERRTTRRPRR